MNSVLIIGCGYIGVRVARWSYPAPVTGVVCSQEIEGLKVLSACTSESHS